MLLFVEQIVIEFVEKHLYQVLNAVNNERFSPAATFAAPIYRKNEILIIEKKKMRF